MASWTHVAVFSRSILAEQTTPAALQIHDTDALVENVSFPDLDLDGGQIGGTLSWDMPPDGSLVTEFVVYLSNGTGRADYANVTATVQEVSVPAEFGFDYPYFWVYSKSSLAEATTPCIHSIVDVDATVLSPQFVGQDLDLNDLGGFVRWTPNGAPGVQDYLLYLAQSDMGANRSQVGAAVLSGSGDQGAIPNGTAREPFDRFLVYARSSLAEQSTPKALGFVEAAQTFQVSNLSFSDEDLDFGEVANYLTWTSPEVTDSLVDYRVFLAEDGLPAVAQGPMVELGAAWRVQRSFWWWKELPSRTTRRFWSILGPPA